MLQELDVLEAQHIADLALNLRKVRDRLMQSVPEADLGEPAPARGAHNVNAALALNGVLATTPEGVALRQAITALPRDIRDKLWVVTQIGHGDLTLLDWERGVDAATSLSDDDIAANLMGEADLHDCLRKGLYEIGAASLPGDAG